MIVLPFRNSDSKKYHAVTKADKLDTYERVPSELRDKGMVETSTTTTLHHDPKDYIG